MAGSKLAMAKVNDAYAVLNYLNKYIITNVCNAIYYTIYCEILYKGRYKKDNSMQFERASMH